MTAFIQGLRYNLKGLRMGLRTGKLLLLGLVRLVVMIIITITAATIILENYLEILNLMWNKPQSMWIVWLWHLVSWLMALLLIGISAVVGFLAAQLLFSVVVMDLMSQLTERALSGQIKQGGPIPWYSYFFYLLRQEIPRVFVPVLISLLLLVLSWFTPLGPVLTIVSPLAASIFLAWDNTDLVPARRMAPFRERLTFLRRHFAFHLGFGILFLIPVLNLLLLSFAPVGATLFYVEQIDAGNANPTGPGVAP
ncbi:MAG: EI24 domain-containing protein [Desulfobacteraceae bacterium]|nr:EI24 domain-containing protein [Desulfobacteraceae bacterium]